MAARKNAGAARSAALTEDEVAQLRAAVDEGRTPTVYLRDGIPSLDVEPGASARVQRFDGSTLLVKPRRIDDELPFEPRELRMTRTAPAQPARTPAAKKPAAKKAAAKPATAKSAAAKHAARPAAVTVTIDGAADREAPHTWTVAVSGGGSRSTAAVPVSAEAVVQAVAALGVERVSKAVDKVVASAREQAERRVEELSRELAEAKKTLRSLEDGSAGHR